ncbi:hypothetical protein ACTXQV_64890, partial [Klebsiella pneumoniae]
AVFCTDAASARPEACRDIQASLGSINLQANSANTQNLIDLQGGTIYAGKDLNLYSSGEVSR